MTSTTKTEPDQVDDKDPQSAGGVSGRHAAVAVVLGLTLLSGVVHGYLDGRWSRPDELRTQGARLDDLPETVGDWNLVQTQQLDASAAELLRCYGSVVREYQNQKTGASVNVAILFGPRGPIAVHTPEICYSSVGTKQVGETQPHTVSTASGHHVFWSAQFLKLPETQPTLDVWYAWSDGGNWEASNYPRFWLTENLYKIQVAGPVGDGGVPPCQDFLESFMPSLEKTVNEAS